MVDQERLEFRRNQVSKRMPDRAVIKARALEREEIPSGEIWRAADALYKSAKWDDKPSFLLSGLKGIGKTTALTAIGCREIMRGRDVRYLPITRLSRIIKSHADEKPQMSDLENCDLLLLDELHRFADLPAWIRSEGVALIDHRYGHLRQTGAAGTLPETGLGNVLGWEIMERFDILITSEEGSYR